MEFTNAVFNYFSMKIDLNLTFREKIGPNLWIECDDGYVFLGDQYTVPLCGGSSREDFLQAFKDLGLENRCLFGSLYQKVAHA